MKEISIIYGNLDNAVEKKAIEVLSELLLEYTHEYPACFSYDDISVPSNSVKIHIGTKADNPEIRANIENELTHAEEYCIKVKDGNAYIAGFDGNGVLYGCIDFYNKYLLNLEYINDPDKFAVNPFENVLPDFEHSSYPSVKNRGLWTWGHVIYDYRSFIDNVVKLKLNTIIIWNDFLPVNSREMLDYAHSCGIRLLWGFAWGWDTDCSVFSPEVLINEAEKIADKYEREYAGAGGDGIYFQSFTELNTEVLNGFCIAEAVTRLVNKTAALIFEKNPELELQFGLHATSVKNQLSFIKNVDPRIRIVWENCGAFPFSYLPSDVSNFEDTMIFAERIATLRGDDDKFGAVTKGFVKLDWSKFKHLSGSVNIGRTSKTFKNNRIVRKSKDWKYVQAWWLSNADKAYSVVKSLADIKHGELSITPLVEDGMFEENIMYPVALFSEMLWDTDTELSKLMTEVALRDYVEFA